MKSNIALTFAVSIENLKKPKISYLLEKSSLYCLQKVQK